MTEKPSSFYRKMFPALSTENIDNFLNSPAVRHSNLDRLEGTGPVLSAAEVHRPPAPFFVDLELTTACQLQCDYCARTFLGVTPQHMDLTLVQKLLHCCPDLATVSLVGLGEPLLYPHLDQVLKMLKAKELRVTLVTNGMALDQEKTTMLLKSGLDAITFSLDSVDPLILKTNRRGSDLATIKSNIRQFMAVRKKRESRIAVNIFSAMQPETIKGLGALAGFAAEIGIPALVVSDLNFPQNQSRSIHSSSDSEQLYQLTLEQMRIVAGHGITLLGPSILDKVVPEKEWPTTRITRPEQITAKQGDLHQNCLAPWRTIVVRVDGSVNFCNCTPTTYAGTIGEAELTDIWYQTEFQEFRKKLYSGPTPASCRICPRL